MIEAAKKALDERGYGMSSVRFICGTQDLHKELEARISAFFGTEDTILYASCFDANSGLFEPLFTEEDAIVSDNLNHASIIDGIRLCKAKRYRYGNADMIDLEEKLKEAQSQRFRIIATDGVFSMDGNAAPLDKILELAEKYDALVMVDESHSAGVVGKTGRGLTEVFNCRGKVDIITGTPVSYTHLEHLRSTLESIPGNRVAAPDTLLRELKGLATEDTIVTSSSGNEYRFNINEKMNDLNIKSLLLTGQLEKGKKLSLIHI